MNLMGLDLDHQARLPWLAAGQPRRVFMAGGSDAHGDLSYRRAGYYLGADNANDTALGKPRNLVFAGAPAGPVIYDSTPPIDSNETEAVPVGLHSLRKPPVSSPIETPIVRPASGPAPV